MKLFRITADYRPKNDHKPQYYVYGEDKNKAKTRFNSLVPWLTIYGVDELTDEEAQTIGADADLHPERYCIW